MNKQTIYQMNLTAKKKAFEFMIEESINHINDERYPSSKDFFLNQKVRYESKLELINEIIEEYLNN